MVRGEGFRESPPQTAPAPNQDPAGFLLVHTPSPASSRLPCLPPSGASVGVCIWSSILALVLALASFAMNQWVYTYSDDQCFWKAEGAKVRIQEILPDGVAEAAGILEGDELQAIQGRPVTSRTMDEARRFINDQPKGKEVLYLIRRNGRQLSLQVQLVKPFNFVGLSVLLSGLVAWAIGLLVVMSSPQRKVARHFFYMGTISLLLPVYAPETAGNVPIQSPGAGPAPLRAHHEPRGATLAALLPALSPPFHAPEEPHASWSGSMGSTWPWASRAPWWSWCAPWPAPGS